jgi:hypothetical protein
MNDIDKDSSRKNSLRLKDFDYSQRRAHFVTIVAQNRKKSLMTKELPAQLLNVCWICEKNTNLIFINIV